jgi:hypothetical protein
LLPLAHHYNKSENSWYPSDEPAAILPTEEQQQQQQQQQPVDLKIKVIWLSVCAAGLMEYRLFLH